MIKGLLSILRKSIVDFKVSHTIAANKIKMRWVSHGSRITGRPTPSGIAYTIYNTISDVPPVLWDNCNKDKDIFLSVEYLLALENTPPENMQFRYVIFTDNNNSVAIAYFQILELNYRLHRPVMDLLRSKKPGIFQDVHMKIADSVSFRLLVCGNTLLSGEHGYALLGNNENLVLHAIAEAAYEIRKLEKSRISVTLIKDFYDRNKHSISILSGFGYYSFDAGPNMIVPIRENWTSFEEYLKQMKSKYRSRATSAIKKGAGIHRIPLELDDIIKYKNNLYELYCEVVDNAKYKLFFLSADYFIELKKRLNERFVCDAYFQGENIVGFTTRIFNNETMEGYVHGLNYGLNKPYELYQNFLLDDIRMAITSKSSRINTGRTSIAMKSSVGAVAENMKCYIRFSGMFSNQLIKPLFFFIKPSEEYCRNPFDE